ncbi:MAG TPA: hypothetical protein VEK78_01500 [Gemmatimonadales bacterium]|nr:hypothetical protein [Gemmatimonadales bacterium]HYT83413.1 hypothetical protein [Gemmatimonadales bacterium]
MHTLHGGAAGLACAAALACNGGLEPAPVPTSCPKDFVGICGTVTFQGPTPDSTDGVFIVAYPTFPRSRSELLNNFLPRPPLQSLPRPFVGSQFYTVPLPNGRYEWVLAVWQKDGLLTPTNADTLLREAGFYRDAGDTTSHGSGIVRVSGTGTDAIDFRIDFGNMHSISDYFPSSPR